MAQLSKAKVLVARVALLYSRVCKYAFKRDKNIEQPDAGCRSPGHENRPASSRPPARGLEEFQALVLGSIFKCAHCRCLARTLRSLPNEFFDVTDFPRERRTSFAILRRIITANKLIIGIAVARVSFSFNESYKVVDALSLPCNHYCTIVRTLTRIAICDFDFTIFRSNIYRHN